MKLGFIGIGEIASAVIKGLCTSNIENTIINLSPRNKENSIYLSNTFSNVKRMESNQQVLNESDIIFISVRPNEAKEILNNLNFKDTHTVVSFIPFLELSELTKIAAPAAKICRAIPLPTAANHNCPIPIFNSDKTVDKIFTFIGQPFIVDTENQLHTLWTLTGFIASFYDLLKELSAWANSNGVNEITANNYIVDMYHSVISQLKKENKIDFNKSLKQASTPNGMNEQALKEIKEQAAP